MLGKIFGKKKPVEVTQKSTLEMAFLGEPKGAGFNELRIEMGRRLQRFSSIENAYLSRLQYPGESTIRIGLVINAPRIASEEEQEIASACAGFLPMDILLLDALDAETGANLKRLCKPLFVADLCLFECPIVVNRGRNADMPSSWESAVICMFVAAPDVESALLIAVEIVRAEGYEVKAVRDGKVHRIDTDNWWDGYVLRMWPNHAQYFPSKDRMDALVATGAYFKGPVLEWKLDSPA